MSEQKENGHDARRRRTRGALLESAAHLFDTHGYTATTVAEIARRANVSERTFYVHFPAKEDLLFAHVQDFAELAWRVARETDSPRPIDRVRAAVLALIDAACGDDVLAKHARLRAVLGTRGEVPRSLAMQLVSLAQGLVAGIAAETDTSHVTVAPMVGAAIGAVEAAGLVGAQLPESTSTTQREIMTRALNAALQGFRAQGTQA